MKKYIGMLFIMFVVVCTLFPNGIYAGNVVRASVQTSKLMSKMGTNGAHTFISLEVCGGYVFSLWQHNKQENRFIIERSDARSSKTVEYVIPPDQIFAAPLFRCVDEKPFFLPLTVSNKKYFAITPEMRLRSLNPTPAGILPDAYGRSPLELIDRKYWFQQIPGTLNRLSSEVQGSSKIFFRDSDGRIKTTNPPWFKDVATAYPAGDLVSLTFYKHPQGIWVQEIVDASSTGIFLENALTRNVQYYRESRGVYEQIPAENLSCDEKVFTLLDLTDPNGVVAKVINHTQDNDSLCGGTTRIGKKLLIHRLVTGSEEVLHGAFAYDTQFVSSNQIAVAFATKRNGQTVLWRSMVDLSAQR